MERLPAGAAVALRGGCPGDPSCGPWEMQGRLGAGGFGNVSLYQHRESGARLAVKACRLELSARHQERWRHELQILRSLDHPNVVKALELPEELDFPVNGVPLLAMEYCSRGDLRKLLNAPENCCGLKESQILSVLSDIGSGIQYLHENRIIHRDLKPENIVLQDEAGKIIYKIIDLGYAKDLDQGSLCTSFVGTLQYLAPELFDNNSYTMTVDFWSLGTVVFECITGFRPFLHNQQPFSWHEKIKKKDPKCIFAWEEMTGEVRFSAYLPTPNSLCRSENIMFARKCFDFVISLLYQKGWDSYMVYLFDKSKTTYEGPFASRTLSDCVNYIVKDSKIQLPVFQLRKIWAEAVHYVIGLKEDYSRLFQGQRAAMLSLLRYNHNLTSRKNNMISTSQQLKAKLNFFQQSIRLDLERYSDQMTYGISSEKMLKAWKDMEEKASLCEKVADIGSLDEQIMALHTEIVELQRSLHVRRQNDVMENLEQRAIELYKQLKSRPPDHVYSDSTEMVKIIVQTVQSQDWVLKELFRHLSKLLGCKQKIIDLLPSIDVALNSIKEADNSVMQMQGKRQREIWHLLKIACTQSSARSGSSAVDGPVPSSVPAWLCQTAPAHVLQPLPFVEASRNALNFAHLLEENLSYLDSFSAVIHEARHDQNSSMMSLDWSWLG
ncbi:PREDICTED: inhibitor of nuclear factor kappa-B kinase subunit alpha [Thamnophis sirtalis]|uniref:Inhibitor of nuclear factor kappa-B kinase subunit alpha n=1 Tax=Thamnophis sirtalis TaxID=35019 RepID=A0A6I9YB30_9SAUR|nr:PREDICTED: inhibitor of nuclear factor kappa-B kinase subunit alpha [Thamnophis sirtalis]